MTVTKQSVIGDVLDYNVDTAEFFFAIGMHCLGCPASRGETIEEAAPFTVPMPTSLWQRSTNFLPQKLPERTDAV